MHADEILSFYMLELIVIVLTFSFYLFSKLFFQLFVKHFAALQPRCVSDVNREQTRLHPSTSRVQYDCSYGWQS